MTIVLRSGKEINADRNLLSIFKSEYGEYELYSGFADKVKLVSDYNHIPKFTKDELLEIAEHLIDNWTAFRFAVNNNDVPCLVSHDDKPIICEG